MDMSILTGNIAFSFNEIKDSLQNNDTRFEMVSINTAEVLEVISKENKNNEILFNKTTNNFIAKEMQNRRIKVEFDLNQGVLIDSVPYSKWWQELSALEREKYISEVNEIRQEKVQELLGEPEEDVIIEEKTDDDDIDKYFDNLHGNLLFNTETKKSDIRNIC